MSNDWARMQSLFHQALNLPPRDRPSFLDDLAQRERAEADELRSLLAAHESVGDDDSSPMPDCGDMFATEAHANPLKHIGDYEIVREVGYGGMGVVYEAIQNRPRRTVALKVVRLLNTSPRAMQRFEHETQILGALRHPGIAQIYDAGLHEEDGRKIPYFAMEYISGAQALTDYAHAGNLDVAARLELMAQLCDGVHYGHQRGVIHRDLKPANILVDETGRPRIIDFGVARAIDSDVAVTTMKTAAGELVGTLQYMSPEQCDGDSRSIDVRSDIYSLGVIAYELLVERLPYDLSDVTIAQAVRVIQEQPPTRASTVRTDLRGDLETIISKALQKDREQRYGAASEMAADIRRFLRHEPIMARPPTMSYLWRTFARRNRGLVVAGAVALAALVVGLAVSTALFIRAEGARVAAEASQRQAEFREYVASIAAASAALRAFDVADARRRLLNAPEQLRNWEWRHLWNRLDHSHATIRPTRAASPLCAFDQSGRHAAFVDGQASLLVWDLVEDRQVARLPINGRRLSAIALGSDGRRVCIADWEPLVQLVDVDTGETIWSWRPPRAARAVRIAGDDGIILTAFNGGQTILFDLETGARQSVRTDSPARNPVAAVRDDGQIVALARGDFGIELRTLAGNRVTILTGHQDGITDLVFSSNGERLASASIDGSIRAWRVDNGSLEFVLRGHGAPVNGVSFRDDGAMLVSGSSDKTVRTWDVATASPRSVLLGHGGDVMGVAWMSDGSVCSRSADGTVKLWPENAGAMAVRRDHAHPVYSFALSGDGLHAVSAGSPQFPDVPADVLFWNLDESTSQRLAQLPGGSRAVAISDDGATVAIGGRLGEVLLCSPMDAGDPTRWFEGTGTVQRLAFDASADHLAAAWRDGSVRVWNVRDGAMVLELTGAANRAWDVAFDPAQARIAYGGEPATLFIVGLDSQEAPSRIKVSGGSVHSIAFSPDGSRIAVGGGDGVITVFSATTYELIARIRGHGQTVTDLAFSPDGSRLASASADYLLKLWDTEHWSEVAALHGHALDVWAVAFSPDGRSIYSASSDRTVRRWDAPRFDEISASDAAVSSGR